MCEGGGVVASGVAALLGGRTGAGPIEAKRQSSARAGTHHDVDATILCCPTAALRRHQDASMSRLSNLRINVQEQPVLTCRYIPSLQLLINRFVFAPVPV